MNFYNQNRFTSFSQFLILNLLLIIVITINNDAKADKIDKLSTELIKLDHKPEAPSFSLPDMQDVPRELADYLGKPVIISFWATWCPPCRKEIPYFNKAWEKVQDDGIEILFVNINEGKDTIEEYIKNHPIKMTIIRDEGAGQLQNWNMTGLPTTFVIDPEGKVIYQAMGERAWDSDEILDKVRALKQTLVKAE